MSKEQQAQIALTILRQARAGQPLNLAAVGARDYVALDANANRRGGVMFRVTIKRHLFHKIIVELTHLDEYNVILWGGARKAVDGEIIEERMAWCDTLADTIYDLCFPEG
jgi:hypothetical protein